MADKQYRHLVELAMKKKFLVNTDDYLHLMAYEGDTKRQRFCLSRALTSSNYQSDAVPVKELIGKSTWGDWQLERTLQGNEVKKSRLRGKATTHLIAPLDFLAFLMQSSKVRGCQLIKGLVGVGIVHQYSTTAILDAAAASSAERPRQIIPSVQRLYEKNKGYPTPNWRLYIGEDTFAISNIANPRKSLYRSNELKAAGYANVTSLPHEDSIVNKHNPWEALLRHMRAEKTCKTMTVSVSGSNRNVFYTTPNVSLAGLSQNLFDDATWGWVEAVFAVISLLNGPHCQQPVQLTATAPAPASSVSVAAVTSVAGVPIAPVETVVDEDLTTIAAEIAAAIEGDTHSASSPLVGCQTPVTAEDIGAILAAEEVSKPHHAIFSDISSDHDDVYIPPPPATARSRTYTQRRQTQAGGKRLPLPAAPSHSTIPTTNHIIKLTENKTDERKEKNRDKKKRKRARKEKMEKKENNKCSSSRSSKKRKHMLSSCE
ncbi:hypothetical protein CAPTEDRAFT_207168 [Capitella teleta]|uniref:Uncharacterized protein n=1 Tax=Capitella teleta TaxID=283909 RepID=R7V1I3_CAPTE|nr:hypothetical protein CAPTEDRAFT_207168 [Capitella teleta]|eukprot:ELU12367.1 hypothetical protein CAPTEDRAFT_207168 [Capitella teleta]